MSSLGSESVLYDSDGSPLAVDNGTAIPADTPLLIAGGSDGTNARYLLVDSSGRQVLVGAGTAGSPIGGIITIQGDPSGTPIPISGNITASNASVSDNDLAIPLFSTLIGGSDGTNLRPLRTFDLDSGGGQQWVLGVGLRKAAGGGSVEFGTSSDPIRIDPTGTTTQPVSGTVTTNQGGTWTVQPGNTANTTPWLATISQGGNSATVTASNALKIDGSAVTQPVSGTVTVTQSTASNLRAQLASESTTGTAIPSTAVMTGGSDGTNLRAFFVDSSGRQFIVGAAANGAAVAGNPVLIAGSDGTNARSIRTATDGTVRVDPTGTTTQPVSGTVAATQSGTWTVQPGNTANTTPWLTTISQGGNSATVTASNALKVDGSAVTQPVSGTVTSNQGTAASLSGKWPVQVTDGTNTMPTGDTVGRSLFNQISDGTTGPVAVKAASTVPIATDKALVVILSPNQQTIPVAAAPSNANSGVIFGRFNYGGGASTIKAVRATTYTEQTTNFTGSVKSSSANDTSAGTGARTIKITYFDQTGAGPFTENATLNGTTAVNLVSTNHCYIEKIEVLTTGSLGWNAGTISLFTGSGGTGTTVGSIGFASVAASTGDNRTLWAHHYVPLSTTAYIYRVSGGTTGNQIGITYIQIATPLTASTPEIILTDFLTIPSGGVFSSRTNANASTVTGFCRLTMYVISNGTNTDYFTSFDYSEQ